MRLLTDICCSSGVGAAGLAETEGRHRHHGSTGSASGSDYSSSNTGRNTSGGVATYVPGTEANRESRAAHGQDPNRYTGSVNNNTGSSQGYGSGNTGSNTDGGVASYIPGTEANRESRAAHGQDPNRYTGSVNNNTGSSQGYGSGNTGSNTGGGVASYIPGTEANRESRAAHGQDPNRYTGSGSNQGYSSNTGSGSGEQSSQHLLL